ncbi:MAG: hypothetical protein RSD41_01810 [Kiritimatiellia bacterium]
MIVNQFWDRVWLSLFLLLLVGFSVALLPENPIIQLAFVPCWMGYWLMTRSVKTQLWLVLFGGCLCETVWGLPLGACLLFYLLMAQLLRALRERFPNRATPWYGAFIGMSVVPLMLLWLWFYTSIVWSIERAGMLTPGLSGMVIAPAIGGVGGFIIFGLAHVWDFRCFRDREETCHES